MVIIEKEEVAIDQLTLFLCLAIVAKRKPEEEMENYFSYEVTPYPTSLFKDGTMRTPKNKSKLKNYLSENVMTSKGVGCIKVADGGALLWCCNWNENEKFTNIFQEYVDKYLI